MLKYLYMKNDNKMVISIDNATLLRIVIFGLVVIGLFYLRELVLVLLTAIVIASFVESAVASFSKIGLGRAMSVVIVYVLTFLVIAGLFYVFVPVFVGELSSLAESVGQYFPNSNIIQALDSGTVSGAHNIVSGISNNASLGEIIGSTQSFIANVSGGFFQTIVSVFGGIFNLILIIIFSFYLSMQERGIEAFLRVVTPIKHEAYVIDLWKRTERKIGLWVQGQMLLGVIIGLLTYLGLTIIGVEYALLIAILAAVSELIPFGLILATVPAVLFGYIDGGVSMAVIVLAFFFIIQQFENYLIAPLIVQKVIGISPIVMIIALLVGATLAGFWGLILAIPVAVCLLEYISDMEKKKLSEMS